MSKIYKTLIIILSSKNNKFLGNIDKLLIKINYSNLKIHNYKVKIKCFINNYNLTLNYDICYILFFYYLKYYIFIYLNISFSNNHLKCILYLFILIWFKEIDGLGFDNFVLLILLNPYFLIC